MKRTPAHPQESDTTHDPEVPSTTVVRVSDDVVGDERTIPLTPIVVVADRQLVAFHPSPDGSIPETVRSRDEGSW
jgi:hypothetical protein